MSKNIKARERQIRAVCLNLPAVSSPRSNGNIILSTSSRKRRSATSAAKSSTCQPSATGMFPMMVILALSTFVSKRNFTARGLSITPLSLSGTRSSPASALQLALDSRELRFYGGGGRNNSNNNNNNNIGSYFDQQWIAAIAKAAATSQEQPVLSLAGAGFGDVVGDCGSNSNKNYNLNSSDSSNINGNNQEDHNDSLPKSEKIKSPFYHEKQKHPPKRGYGPYINLSPEEREFFLLLRKAKDDGKLSTTLQ